VSVAQRLLAVLALVLALGAADPTPRFLGIARPGEGPELPFRAHAHAVAQDYDIPAAVCIRARGQGHAPAPLAALPAALARTRALGPSAGPTALSAAGRRSPPTRETFAPPLRL